MKRTFLFLNNGNSMRPANDEEYWKWIKKMPEKVSVTVQPFKNQRSQDQNEYYFKVVVGMIAEDTGNSKEDTHEALKSMFLSKTVHLKNVVGQIARSTTSLKTDEFEIYLENIRRWAAQQGLSIPTPNETVKGVIYNG